MNNTTKARYDVAKRMIAGRIDVDEVVMMTQLPKEEVQKLKDEFDKVTQSELDGLDIDLGPILMDNYVTPEEEGVFEQIKKQVQDSVNRKGE